MSFFKPKFWDKNQISFFALILFPISLIIRLLSLFKYSITKTNQCSIPVICVGNIYLGGTGKTPLCIEVFLILKNLNLNPVFIRKKYNAFQDEFDLQKKIGPIYQNKKRIEAVKNAIKNNADVAILDDGFQDFSISKNFSIVCFNEKQWIGNGLTIPSGPLRENISALKRSNCVIINGEPNQKIENKIFNETKDIKIFYSKYIAQDINSFKNKKVIAFAGIGNPENFFSLLKENAINVLSEIKFPDHYKYSQNELKNLINKAKENDAILITTEKDYVRIDESYKEKIQYLKIIVEIKNKEEFINEIKKIL